MNQVWSRVLVAALVTTLGGCATAGGGGDDVQQGPDAASAPRVDASPPADATVDATPPPDAPPPELGRIGTWGGKVNVHRVPGADWARDEDCSSGADINPLVYCRKFFSATMSAPEVPRSPKPTPVWWDANCTNVYPGDGQHEYACMP